MFCFALFSAQRPNDRCIFACRSYAGLQLEYLGMLSCTQTLRRHGVRLYSVVVLWRICRGIFCFCATFEASPSPLRLAQTLRAVRSLKEVSFDYLFDSRNFAQRSSDRCILADGRGLVQRHAPYLVCTGAYTSTFLGVPRRRSLMVLFGVAFGDACSFRAIHLPMLLPFSQNHDDASGSRAYTR